jgi:hypothetical protein
MVGRTVQKSKASKMVARFHIHNQTTDYLLMRNGTSKGQQKSWVRRKANREQDKHILVTIESA